MKRALWLGLLSTFAIGTAHAATEKVAINLVSADGAPQAIGSVTVTLRPSPKRMRVPSVTDETKVTWVGLTAVSVRSTPTNMTSMIFSPIFGPCRTHWVQD